MTAASENPYQSPPFVVDDASAAMRAANTDWKAVLRRWEILRVAYNVLVGATGLLTLTRFPSLTLDTIVLAVIYGLCANGMYLLGPVAELYFRWFAEAWEGRLTPEWVTDVYQSFEKIPPPQQAKLLKETLPKVLKGMSCSIDLDTARTVEPRADVLGDSSSTLPNELPTRLADWAVKEGCHLIVYKVKPAGSARSYIAVRPLNVRLWACRNAAAPPMASIWRSSSALGLGRSCVAAGSGSPAWASAKTRTRATQIFPRKRPPVEWTVAA